MKQRLPFTLIFVAFTLFLMVGQLKPFLTETAALTPFYVDESIVGLLEQPCGILLYLAAGLQSCFALPFLGAFIFVILLVALAYVVRWAFRVSDAWFGLCWVPSFGLLLHFTQLGYLIYTVKHPSFAFADPLGLLIAFFLIGVWYRLGDWRLKVAFMLIVPAVGFWLFGFFALLVVPSLAFCELAQLCMRPSEFHAPRAGMRHFLWAMALCLSGFLLPVILKRLLPIPIDIEVGHVSFTNDLSALRRPWLVAFFSSWIFACFRFEGSKRWMTAVASVVFLAVGSCAYLWSFRDTNFLATLRMKHAAEVGQWEQVLQIARSEEQEPTRAQVCLTRLALFKTGRMGDILFTYPDGSADYRAPQPNQWLRLMIGPLLYYHYGKTGFAYRWAMEDLVEYGERPAYLRYLYRVALLNGEDALAHRYARTLARTLFYKETDSDLEAEATAIRPLLNYTDQLDGDNGLVEFYLLNSFALSEGGSREMVELSLMNGLITKNTAGFWSRFMALLPTWEEHIPTHYQEAALMMSQLQGGAPVADLPIDPAVAQRFQRLVAASSRMGDNAANAALLRPEFGDSYWYYYFFVEGLKTN
ncbi:MAG: DUF6057 family protein [Bacteroidaceae bacterium]|nr:DUF6057 family protein [Bacteroidaceae bacterium]